MQAPILSPDALIKLTHRTQPSAQARILTAWGINFKRHPCDGKVITTEDAVKFAFGRQAQSNSRAVTSDSNSPKWTRSL